MFKKRPDSDFHEEIQSHIEIEADRLIAEGLSPLLARQAAQRAFGNVTSHREHFYEANRWMWLDNGWRSLCYAARQLRKSPVSAVTVILSLALGIGVTTAIFSLADQALLRMLPVQDPQALVLLDWSGDFPGDTRGAEDTFPHPFFRELRAENEVFAEVFATVQSEVSFSIGQNPGSVMAEMVSGGYFSTLGIQPHSGRLIGNSDDLQPGSHPVVVLSFDFWKNVAGGDPGIVGRSVQVNSYPMTVIGVAQQGFHGVDVTRVPAIWVPVLMKRQVTPSWDGLEEARMRWLQVFARLRQGVGREQATAALKPWFEAYKRADMERADWPALSPKQMSRYLASTLEVTPGGQGRSWTRRVIGQPMLVLTVAAGLILLLACLNVANLSLARALARQRVTSLKSALGASRRRVLSEGLIESALLASIGAAFGTLLAPLLTALLVSFVPQRDVAQVAFSTQLDLRVLVFALFVTVLAAVVSGAAPALYSSSIPPASVLRQESTAVAGGMRLRRALVVGQFALALVLLIGAGLFARTLATLRAQGPGYSTANLMMFRLDPMSLGYNSPGSKALFRELLEDLRAVAGIEDAGLGRWEMLSRGGWNNPVTVQSTDRFVTENMGMNAVSPGFFRTLGLTLSQGRDFDHSDSYDEGWRLRSAIINEEFRRRYFGAEDPLGALVGIGAEPGTATTMTIIGVVPTFQDFGMREPAPQVFFPLWERTVEAGTFYVRTNLDSIGTARSIRRAVGNADPNLTLLALRTIDDQLDRLLTTERMLATLAGAFAAVATALAMVGLFGVLSFSAERRTKEIGIRYALGAPHWVAGGLIVREAAGLALTGLLLALPLSWLMGRYVKSQLFGVQPMDPATILLACTVLVAVCLVASALTARRVGTVDPLDALRSE